jgi:ribulose-5-phosphate 4-epimerase/fuculose-1-phosphate aldolase
MNAIDKLLNELVVANRVLSKEDIVDAYGHVSIRHPDDPKRFFLARSLPPEMVEREDIMEFSVSDAEPIDDERQPPVERFIHSAILEARPDVQAVVHAHAEDVLPFGITDVPLKPVIHSGSFIGSHVPVWDIADNFGDTNMLVSNVAQGRDLAGCLGDNNVALMRGHGFAAAARTLIEAVRLSVYLPRNARVQMAAMQMGGALKVMSEGEIAARATTYKPFQIWRAWQYWAHRAGCSHLVGEDSVTAADNAGRKPTS